MHSSRTAYVNADHKVVFKRILIRLLRPPSFYRVTSHTAAVWLVSNHMAAVWLAYVDIGHTATYLFIVVYKAYQSRSLVMLDL